jgi:hypothetical protein
MKSDAVHMVERIEQERARIRERDLKIVAAWPSGSEAAI